MLYFVRVPPRWGRTTAHYAANQNREAILLGGDYRLYCSGQPINPKLWTLAHELDPHEYRLCTTCRQVVARKGEPGTR